MVDIPLFPILPVGFPVKWSPTLETILTTSKASGREARLANRGSALYEFELLFSVLRDQTQNQTKYSPFIGFTDYMQLCQFWLQMYGRAGRFYFDAPWDDSRTDQVIATGDGTSTKFLMVRTFGLSGASITEVVGGVNSITNVKINGTIQPTDSYSISGNILTFTSAPANGAAIQATFSYYYLCRFFEDDQDFEEIMKNLWSVSSLKFRSILPTPNQLDLVGLQLSATGFYLNNYNPTDPAGPAPDPIITPSSLIIGNPAKWPPPAPPSDYHIGAVHLDGNTYLQSAASMFADNATGTLSIWIYDPYGGTQDCILSLLPRVSYQPGNIPSNVLVIDNSAFITTKRATNWDSSEGLFDSATNYTLSSGSFDASAAWTNIIYSWDNATRGVLLMAVNGTVITNLSAHLFPVLLSWGPLQFFSGLTNGSTTLQAESGGGFDNYSGPFDPDYGADANTIADVADLWFAPGVFIDLTIASNVEKFYNSGNPVDLGTNGQNPTGTSPLVFFHLDVTDTTANDFGNNRGSGGSLARTGNFTIAPTHP